MGERAKTDSSLFHYLKMPQDSEAKKTSSDFKSLKSFMLCVECISTEKVFGTALFVLVYDFFLSYWRKNVTRLRNLPRRQSKQKLR